LIQSVIHRPAAWFLAAGFFCSVVYAAPRTPARDDDVLERLPPALLAARQVVTPSPETSGRPSLASSLALARHFVEIGQTYSDPRAYGYAQAALGAWWDATPAPDDVLVMRARILQFRHEFPEALRQLETALQHDQFNPDAWLLLASIEQVLGNVPASRAACLKLIPISDPLIGAACVAETAALTARARDADGLLSAALDKPTASAPAERAWAWTILAEIRARTATTDPDFDLAEAAFRKALTIQPDSVYTRSAFADFLLDRNRTREVRDVLGDAMQADALLLRAAIAARRDGDPDAGLLADNLDERFNEARERGDTTHLREQARFALDVRLDPQTGVDLAVKNFAIQREPADAQLLIDAAVAANRRSVAEPAINWLRLTGIDAPRLRSKAGIDAK
jgi:Tfp pilus assembly protein PilF